jgi:glycosyltransferase involved in cell wall biosynthesis
MRIGQNPAKSIEKVVQPAKVTITMVTYIPFLSGYYAESLEVLKVCLGSLWENTPQPYDLFVFDNASCHEVRSYLHETHQRGRIQYLLLSERNIGKGGAWNLIFQGAPGEVIAYADSDIYFNPGWLEEALDILESFPKPGMVTSRPLRTPEEYYSSTLEWAKNKSGVILKEGDFQSWEVYSEHTHSLGISTERAREWYQKTCDRRIQYKERRVYIGAAHFEFLAHKSVLQSALPIKMDRPMGQVRELDKKLNQQGYLHLSTIRPLIQHMGNRLPDGEKASDSAKQALNGRLNRLLDFPLIRRPLLYLYNKIFQLYYDRS